MPPPIVRDSFQIWPAKRREVIVDFTKYMDGTPTKKGDVVYLVNTLQMTTGRKPDADGDPETGQTIFPNYKVPILKFVIGTSAKDQSVIPTRLRPLPQMPSQAVMDGLPHRTFLLERNGGSGSEIQWLINGLQFDPVASLADVRQGSGEVWTIANGGGGWVHPLHIHMEEHRVLSRTGGLHPDDNSKEDVVALGPGESVTVYRRFRTFLGPYVCHCHNLAHEDHAMMFGWSIVP